MAMDGSYREYATPSHHTCSHSGLFGGEFSQLCSKESYRAQFFFVKYLKNNMRWYLNRAVFLINLGLRKRVHEDVWEPGKKGSPAFDAEIYTIDPITRSCRHRSSKDTLGGVSQNRQHPCAGGQGFRPLERKEDKKK